MGRRLEPLVFLAAAGLGWVGAMTASSPGGPLGPALVAASIEDPRGVLEAGIAAERRGDYARADALYRAAWQDASTRELAARLLRDMHDKGRYELPVDEESVESTRAALGEGFFRMETEHFVVLSNADQRWTSGRAALLERAHHQFQRVFDRLELPLHPPREKLLCVFVRDHATYAAFARENDGVEAPWIAGYYAGRANRVVLYDDRTGPSFNAAAKRLDALDEEADEAEQRAAIERRRGLRDLADRLEAHAEAIRIRVAIERDRLGEQALLSSEAKTIHEAVHLLAFNCGVQSRAIAYPFWVTEGLATGFETDNPNAAFGPDHATEKREAEFDLHAREGLLHPLEDLVRIGQTPPAAAEAADVLYSQSYALFAYLYRYERRSLAAFLRALLNEPPGGGDRGERHAELFEEHFGRADRLERRMLIRLGHDLRAVATR
jgi:hypothetical protein